MHFNTGVIRKDPEHIYYNAQGSILKGVSGILKLIQEPFDGNGISRNIAISKLKGSGERMTSASIDRVSQEIQAGWKGYGIERANMGTVFHEEMENFIKFGTTNGIHKKLVEAVYLTYFRDFYRNYAEVILSDGTTLAGTADVLSSHSSKQQDFIHIRDYKTNKEKPVNDVNAKAKNKFMLSPVDYMLDNKYNYYCLQQSIYAYLLTLMGYKIGSISLIWVHLESGHHERVDLPFMYEEAKKLVQFAKTVN